MKTRFFLSLCLTALLLSSCERREIIRGHGETLSEERNVGAFDEIRLHTSADIEVYYDSVFSLEISDFENLVRYIRTSVNNHVLTINTEHHVALKNSKTKIRIGMPDLQASSISGSGEIHVRSPFPNYHYLQISGSGKHRVDWLEHNVPTEIRISGSGSISMQGKLRSLDAMISGSGDLFLYDLECQKAYCTVSGSGDAHLYVTDYLEANISGSGDITYSGQPAVKTRVSGSGSVRQR